MDAAREEYTCATTQGHSDPTETEWGDQDGDEAVLAVARRLDQRQPEADPAGRRKASLPVDAQSTPCWAGSAASKRKRNVAEASDSTGLSRRDVGSKQTISGFGAAIRQLRFRSKMTTRELAAASGLAPSTISKVENGLMSPTYDNILRLAAGLKVDVDALFNPQSEQMATGRRSVTRHGQGTRLEARDYSYEMLCADLSHKRFVPIVATLPVRSVTEAAAFLRHGGDEFVYVLSGEVVVLTETYEPLTLGPGDSCYFDSSMGHTLLAAGDREAVVLWIASTPQARAVVGDRHHPTEEPDTSPESAKRPTGRHLAG